MAIFLSSRPLIPASCSSIVRTLLLSVEDVELSALGLDGGGLQIRDVAAGGGLGDREADDLLAAQARAAHQLLLVVVAKVEHWAAGSKDKQQVPCGKDETRSSEP